MKIWLAGALTSTGVGLADIEMVEITIPVPNVQAVDIYLLYKVYT
jgi:hypothetical protein